MKWISRVATAAIIAISAGMTGAAWSQGYPGKPIRIIVPYPPGGGNDIVVRTIGQKLAEIFAQSVIVENKPGAGTLIGAEAAAKSPADGYTVFLGTIATLAINPSLYRQLPYDAIKDFVPVTQIVSYPLVLVTHPGLPVKSVSELIAYAKERPGTLHYASFGNGSSPHLGTELLKTMTGINIIHVPYKGGPPAIADLLGGQVAMMFVDLPPTIQHIRSGRLRALAMSTVQRTPLMPDLPTMMEAGVPGFGFSSWAGLVVPAGTATEIVNRLHGEVVRVLGYPDVAKQLSGLGADPVGSTPQQFGDLIKSETVMWAKVVKDSGAKVD